MKDLLLYAHFVIFRICQRPEVSLLINSHRNSTLIDSKKNFSVFLKTIQTLHQRKSLKPRHS